MQRGGAGSRRDRPKERSGSNEAEETQARWAHSAERSFRSRSVQSVRVKCRTEEPAGHCLQTIVCAGAWQALT